MSVVKQFGQTGAKSPKTTMINLQHKRKLDSLAYLVIQNELLENIKFVEDFQTSKKQYTDKIPLQNTFVLFWQILLGS